MTRAMPNNCVERDGQRAALVASAGTLVLPVATASPMTLDGLKRKFFPALRTPIIDGQSLDCLVYITEIRMLSRQVALGMGEAHVGRRP